jgi:hypothetical protein
VGAGIYPGPTAAATLNRIRSLYASSIRGAPTQNAAPSGAVRLRRAIGRLVSSTRSNGQRNTQSAEDKDNKHTSQDQLDGHETSGAWADY